MSTKAIQIKVSSLSQATKDAIRLSKKSDKYFFCIRNGRYYFIESYTDRNKKPFLAPHEKVYFKIHQGKINLNPKIK